MDSRDAFGSSSCGPGLGMTYLFGRFGLRGTEMFGRRASRALDDHSVSSRAREGAGAVRVADSPSVGHTKKDARSRSLARQCEVAAAGPGLDGCH
jgi:hypothetical protein